MDELRKGQDWDLRHVSIPCHTWRDPWLLASVLGLSLDCSEWYRTDGHRTVAISSVLIVTGLYVVNGVGLYQAVCKTSQGEERLMPYFN